MEPRILQLISIAEERMMRSNDAIHNHAHAKRVAEYAKDISDSLTLDQNQQQALLLAAWWHDVGRTITKKPSVVIMRCIDDGVSAFLLYKESLKVKEFSPIISIAIRVMLCKNIGAGRIITRVILPKRHRIVLHILKDADALDVLQIERVEQLRLMAEQSKLNQKKYKLAVWWFLHSKEFDFKTETAKNYFQDTLDEFMKWLQKKEIFEWHTDTFGVKWLEKSMLRAEKVVEKIKKLL